MPSDESEPFKPIFGKPAVMTNMSDRQHSPAAMRMRRTRQRRRDGVVLLHVEIPEDSFVAAAVERGLLRPNFADDPIAVAEAAAAALREWIEVARNVTDSENMLRPAGVVENGDRHAVAPPRRTNGHSG